MEDASNTAQAEVTEVMVYPEVENVSTSVPLANQITSANSAAEQVKTQPEDAPSNGGGWLWLRRLILPTAEERVTRYYQRLEQLDESIEQHPQASSNYVLRGELHLDAGLYPLAVADFQRALELGTQQLETERWGVITQAMRDRAHEGLNRALRLQARTASVGKLKQA